MPTKVGIHVFPCWDQRKDMDGGPSPAMTGKANSQSLSAGWRTLRRGQQIHRVRANNKVQKQYFCDTHREQQANGQENAASLPLGGDLLPELQIVPDGVHFAHHSIPLQWQATNSAAAFGSVIR